MLTNMKSEVSQRKNKLANVCSGCSRKFKVLRGLCTHRRYCPKVAKDSTLIGPSADSIWMRREKVLDLKLRRINARAIAKTLGVSVRTVFEDQAALSEHGWRKLCETPKAILIIREIMKAEGMEEEAQRQYFQRPGEDRNAFFDVWLKNWSLKIDIMQSVGLLPRKGTGL
jgi:hypothetical protein